MSIMSDTANKNDIIRYAGDTYPVHMVIKINGVPVDISNWSVICRCVYNFPAVKGANGTIARNPFSVTAEIDCVPEDAANGKILIYPQMRWITDTVNGRVNNIRDFIDNEALIYSNAATAPLEVTDYITDAMELADGTHTLKSNQCWTAKELDSGFSSMKYSIIREKAFDSTKRDANNNIIYYKETMTHKTGNIILMERV